MGERPDYGYASQDPQPSENVLRFEGEKKILPEKPIFNEAQSARIRRFLDLDQAGGIAPLEGSGQPPEWMLTAMRQAGATV